MPHIYTIGETILDILFKNDKPVDAVVGGSMLNTSITLARLDQTISFITETGNDQPGELMTRFIQQNGVDCSYLHQFKDGRTPIALAFLNEHNNASYSFYKNYPTKRFQVQIPPFKPNDIVLFGSFFAISKEVRKQLLTLLGKAREQGCILIYDPNFRKPHLHELQQVKPFIEENIELAHIIRGSNEDFQLIFNAGSAIESYDIIDGLGCSLLVYTHNSQPVELVTPQLYKKYPVPAIRPVSTIAAGDNFNAGLIYGLAQKQITLQQINNLTESDWDPIIQYGIQFSSEVCQSYDNYIKKL